MSRHLGGLQKDSGFAWSNSKSAESSFVFNNPDLAQYERWFAFFIIIQASLIVFAIEIFQNYLCVEANSDTIHVSQ